MSRTIALLVTLCGCFLSAVSAWGQRPSDGMLSETELGRFGLERVWWTQVDLDPARGRVTQLTSYVSVADITTVFDVHYNDRRQTFSEHDLDRFGRVLGREGAKQAAEVLVAGLKTRNIEGTVEKVLIPEAALYAVTDRALVHAIDAQTGATRWSAVIGERNHPTERPGVSEPYVAILNGTDLYLLKRQTGEIIWKRRVRGVPGAGAAITNDYVVVPTVNGIVELYDLKETRTLPEIYKSNGRVLIQPTVTEQIVAWPTDRGFLYVARANKKGLRYRLEAKETIVSQASYFAPNFVFVASIDGYVYCLHELTGSENWLFSTGEPVSQTPVPVGENLYLVTDKGSLFCLEMKSGQARWISSGFRSFLAASQERVYCLGDTGRLVIVDAKTGGRIGSLGLQLLDVFYPNLQTDRIYLGNKLGLLMCLRETKQVWPLVHAGVVDPAEAKPGAAGEEPAEADQAGEEKAAKQKPGEAKSKPKPAGPPAKPGAEPADDPFGPGGAGDEKPAAPPAKEEPVANPFGAGAAPPAGEAPPAAEDPFK